MQEELTKLDFNTQGSDGKFGKNTLSAVKSFQSANGLTADGKFGKNSLNKLEELIGHHLDPANCTSPIDSSTSDNIDSSYATSKYKVVQGLRMNDVASRNTAITAYSNGHPGNMTVSQYFANLHNEVLKEENSYVLNSSTDCAGYLHGARQAGYSASTSNFCYDTAYFGYIELKNDGTRNYDKLIPGMELHQACRKSADSNYYYSKHIGVYYGKYDFGDGVMRHAVYQSCTSHNKILALNSKTSGPNLTSMNDDWTYWAWSKYIRLD